MAEELQFSSRSDNKRKFDDPAAAPPSSDGTPPARRPTGFSAPLASPSPDNHAAAAPPSSYNSVPPPPDGIQLAKQRAQEIAARLFSDAEAKRPRVENGSGADDSSDKGFAHAVADHLQKSVGQQIPSQVGMASSTPFSGYGYLSTSRKIEIPNGRVGVIIGKGGETIKYLQMQSGAKIQVTRDNDADPYSLTRMVELTGTSEQISKAEQLVKDVLAEAEAGGSGGDSGRRSGGFQVGAEQFTMKVPNDKVGLIIGKGGENIKNMQAKSGARIQLIPLHPPPGDMSTERTVQIDGTAEQIESAKQLVNEVITSNRFRNSQMTGGYRPPRPPTNWGPPGQPPTQQPGYGYMQPGAYPGAPPQYTMPQPHYGGYPQPPVPASGWDQSPNPPAQQTTPGTGYDYYNQQQQPPAGGSAPADNTGYNYGQPASYGSQGSYGDASYSQSATGQQQGYGQENYSGGYQAPAAQPGYAQPASNPQGGYDHQQGYGSTPAYGAVANPTQDGSTATNYGYQGGPTQAPPAQQVASTLLPSPTQQGYGGQPPSTTPATYPSPGTAQPGYGLPPTSQPPGYGGQPPAQAGYPQPSYGQPPQGQKPTPGQAVYAQAQQPPTSQAGYVQPSSVQTGYQLPPSQTASAYIQPSGYGQQQSYGGAPPPSQPGYGQQQQPYGDSYGSGGYSQPPAYSSDSSAHGAYEAAGAAQAVPSGVTKASPQV